MHLLMQRQWPCKFLVLAALSAVWRLIMVPSTPGIPLSVITAKKWGLSPPFKRRCRRSRERANACANEHRRQLQVVAVGRARRTSDTGRCAHDGGGRLRAAWPMPYAMEPRPTTDMPTTRKAIFRFVHVLGQLPCREHAIKPYAIRRNPSSFVRCTTPLRCPQT